MNKFIKYFIFLILIIIVTTINVYGAGAVESSGNIGTGTTVDDINEATEENKKRASDSGFNLDSNGDSNDEKKCYYRSEDKKVVSKVKFSVQNYAFKGKVFITYGEDVVTNLEVKNLNASVSMSSLTIDRIDNLSSCPQTLLVVDNAESDIYVFNNENNLNQAKSYYNGQDIYILNNISSEDLAEDDQTVFGKLNAYTCRDLLGDTLVKLINKYYGIVYLIVPILVIVLGFLDFGSAILQSNADEMKKNSKKFIKRLVMGVVVMILPTILNIIFYIVNFAKDPDSVDNYFNYITSDSCIYDEGEE